VNRIYDFSADQLLNDNENSVVEIQNHELNEQLALISQLDEEEKNALVKIINSMLTKKWLKDLLDGKINLM
jgi:hypothetical protein